MDPKLRLALSPIALATALVLTGAQSLVSTPWLPVGAAQASHCNPPPTCDSSCNCDACYSCDSGCGGSGSGGYMPEKLVTP
jgi:hypothetical protein